MSIKRETGEYRISTTAGEQVRAFVPKPLPPDPPVDLSELFPLLDRANQALGRLDGSIAMKTVSEITGRRRSRVFIYSGCIELIGAGTEPLR